MFSLAGFEQGMQITESEDHWGRRAFASCGLPSSCSQSLAPDEKELRNMQNTDSQVLRDLDPTVVEWELNQIMMDMLIRGYRRTHEKRLSLVIWVTVPVIWSRFPTRIFLGMPTVLWATSGFAPCLKVILALTELR